MRMLSKTGVVLVALLAGCASPKEKYEECQQRRCASLKAEMAKDLCDRTCEKDAYGDRDTKALGALCDKDDAVACLRMATGATPADSPTVAAKIQGCCDRKNARCCGLLGKMYSRGMLLAKDEPKGFALMEQACSLGDGTSCVSPGLERIRNNGFERAHQLLAIGCGKDSPNSCGLLGVLYRDGKGVKRDLGEARKHLDKACRLGATSSCKALTRL